MYARILLKPNYLMMFGERGYLAEVLRVLNVDQRGRVAMEVFIEPSSIEAVRTYASSFTPLRKVQDPVERDRFTLVTEDDFRAALMRVENAEAAARQALTACEEALSCMQELVDTQGRSGHS